MKPVNATIEPSIDTGNHKNDKNLPEGWLNQLNVPIMKDPALHYEKYAEFRFYEELNDFLPPAQCKQTMSYAFNGTPGIKDPIEVLGVPHTEVDLIIVNGESVGFNYQLQNADRVSVYPVSEGLAITPVINLRDKPLRNISFVADVNLGRLAKLLRLFGFDTLLANNLSDKEIVELAAYQERIILTRDRRLLYAKKATHGYWVRSVMPKQQLEEVFKRFNLANLLRPFSRCSRCNGLIDAVKKEEVLNLLQPKTKQYYENFYRCRDCAQVYWEGSHVGKVKGHFSPYFSHDRRIQ